jgi:hypothetical protein
MKKLFKRFKNLYLGIYKEKNAAGMILLSLSMIASFLWSLLGVIAYLLFRFRKPEWKCYGIMALTGTCLNLLMYLVQIVWKLTSTI